jgi:hypothetical protein
MLVEKLERLKKNGQKDGSNNFLIKVIWLYFILLILEGALRKWLLPGLAGPLLIVRDPVALWLIILSVRKGVLRVNPYLVVIVFIGFASIFTAGFLGHGSFPVALYGARIMLLHFPLIFVIGSAMNRAHVIAMGNVILWMTLPMTLLIAMQFFSPQSAWVNRGIGGVEEAGFQGALGHFRPPGTFSFITGTYLFYGLSTCFVFYYWLNPKGINKVMLVGSTLGVLTAIPLSISRTLFFEVCLTVAFAFIAVARKGKYLSKFASIIAVVFVAIFILSQTSFFQHATETFFSRFTNANETEGGVKGVLGDRFLGGLVSALLGSLDQPFFGYGIGMGTNVGAQLLAGKTVFLLHEEEWGRIIDELGPLFGLAVVYIRVAVSVKIAMAAYKKILKGDMLPWLLVSFGFLLMAQGFWSQPTSLGFCTLTTGLMIASLKRTTPTPAVSASLNEEINLKPELHNFS